MHESLTTRLRHSSPWRTLAIPGSAVLDDSRVRSSLSQYLTFGDSPRLSGDVLNAYPHNGLVDAARLGLALVVITSYPLQAFAFRTLFGTLSSALAALLSPACASGCPTPSASADGTSDAQELGAASWLGCCHSWVSRHFALDRRSVATTLFLLTGTTLVALVVTDLGKVSRPLQIELPIILAVPCAPPHHNQPRSCHLDFRSMGAAPGTPNWWRVDGQHPHFCRTRAHLHSPGAQIVNRIGATMLTCTSDSHAPLGIALVPITVTASLTD